MHDNTTEAIRHISILGNYLPRRCGIATFTTDLDLALAAEVPQLGRTIVAVNDPHARHDYESIVRFEIEETELASYRRAAEFLNVGPTEVLSIQHEYGIFGGNAGSHLLALLEELRMPVVTTLHTILKTPNDGQRRVMNEIVRRSTRLVVMSECGAELLHSVHGVSRNKIDLIPHGIPSIPRTSTSKRQLGFDGKSIILTFGLLSPDKGIEHVIAALPAVVERHPNVVYVIVGATHPHVKQHHGEAYRRSLELLAHRLKIEAHIVFYDRFVSLPELVGFLSASDIYVTPYLNLEQITSGTLAYAVGAGKAVISTPYAYARELLGADRGILVPPRDPTALGEAIDGLLRAPDAMHGYGDRARSYANSMEWPRVARLYVQSMSHAYLEHTAGRRHAYQARTLATRPMVLPQFNDTHLRVLTDATGVLQHAVYSIPRYEDGYCVDDNARALLLTTLMEHVGTKNPASLRKLACRYLAFVHHAFNPLTGRFRNFMSYDRRWLEQSGSPDSHGRALWALGAVVGRSRDPSNRALSGQLFRRALVAMRELDAPRAGAFALLGIHEYLRAFQGDREVEAQQQELAERLLSRFLTSGRHDWHWCEDSLSYDNARLPQALIVSGTRLANTDMTRTGLRALEWLAKLQCSEQGYFAPVGSDGLYTRGGVKPEFDQQPVEACASISAYLDAWRVTGDESWTTEMRRAFRWFLGENVVSSMLYVPATGGCHDGLQPDGANQNQGAESTLSFLLALAEMSAFDSEYRLMGRTTDDAAAIHADGTMS